MKRLLVVAALASCVAACGPSGKLTGTVQVQGGSPAGATVLLQGTLSKAAAVGEDGAFGFEALPDGVYLLEVAAPSTVEARQSVRAEVSGGTGEVEPVVFRGVGSVSGRVTSPTGAAGAQVFVAGQPGRVNVADDGTFTLEKVPSGEQTLVAVRDGYQPAAVKLTVPFQTAVQNQVLALTEVAHGEGQISGRAYYFDRDDQSGITVRVEGTSLSAQTGADGSYTLRGAPLGYVTLVAEASGYQPARAENVLSAAGGVLHAPELRLSLLERRFAGVVYDFTRSPSGKGALFVGQPEGDASFYLYWVDLTGAAPPRPVFRYGLSGNGFDAYWQADGKRVAVKFSGSGTLWAVNLESGEVDQATQNWSSGAIKLANERLFFQEPGDDGATLLRVYSFVSRSTQTIEAMVIPTGYCPVFKVTWDWFQVSPDGKVAYFVDPGQGKPHEVRLWNGSAQTVSGGKTINCTEFHGGSQLLGFQFNGSPTLYNLTSGSPATLYGGGTYYDPYALFSGDDQYVLFMESGFNGQRILKSVPVAGGTVNTLYTGTTLFMQTEVVVQPKGPQVAFHDDSSQLVVMSAAGTKLKTYPAHTSQLSYWYGPEGKYLAFLHGDDRLMQLADASDLQPVTLGEVPKYLPVSLLVTFSPHEKALGMTTKLPSGTSAFRLYRTEDGKVLDLPFIDAGAQPQALNWSETDKYALFSDSSGDRIIDIAGGTARNLQQRVQKIGYYTSPFFTGDEARLIFGSESWGAGRLLSAHSDDGSVHYAADAEYNLSVFPIPGSGRVVLMDPSETGEPRGLYTLLVP